MVTYILPLVDLISTTVEAVSEVIKAPPPGALEVAAQTLSYVLQLIPILLKASFETVKIFILTIVLSLPLGLIFALGAISKYKFIRFLSKTYIWLLRGTPLMLQLFFVYFGLPSFGIVLDRFSSAIVAFVLNYAAYFAEIYRGGIQSIEKGQYEAAKTLGFSRWQTMRYIIIPQTIKRIIPPVSNETITLIKDTALVAAIAVPELLKSAKDAVNRDVDTTAFFVAAGIYLFMTFLLTMLSRYLEKRFSYYEQNNTDEKQISSGRRKFFKRRGGNGFNG
ncbi:MAG: amino acid transporter permease [Clostridia bacterium]|nr:amino acid transporter permease [Clostridia bacterium]